MKNTGKLPVGLIVATCLLWAALNAYTFLVWVPMLNGMTTAQHSDGPEIGTVCW